MQPHPDGEKVVENARSSLRGHQRQWTISEKESFAILFALKKWRIYIHGRTDVIVFTDHSSLCGLCRVSQPRNQRLCRWLMDFLDANVTLKFLSGKLHTAANACCRIFAPELEAPTAKPKALSMESTAEDLMAIQVMGKREELAFEQKSDPFI
jgi:hypothetical protein